MTNTLVLSTLLEAFSLIFSVLIKSFSRIYWLLNAIGSHRAFRKAYILLIINGPEALMRMHQPLKALLLVALVSLAIPLSSAGEGMYTIGVQGQTTSDQYAAANLPNANVQAYETMDLAIAALENGDVQFVLGDLPTLAYYAVDNSDKGLSVVGSFGDDELFGIAVPKEADRAGAGDLLNAMDAALGEMVDDGSYDVIYNTWFSGAVVLTDDSTASTATTYPTVDGDSTGALADVVNGGNLTFGSDIPYMPFEGTAADGTTVIGFDADVAAGICTKLSAAYNTTITCVMETRGWDELTAFGFDGYDAVISAMTKTDERAQMTQFTRAYYTSKQGILASSASPTITSVADLNAVAAAEEEDSGLPGLSLLVSAGALGAIALRRRH